MCFTPPVSELISVCLEILWSKCLNGQLVGSLPYIKILEAVQARGKNNFIVGTSTIVSRTGPPSYVGTAI